ncbi:MAG: Hsp20/alpha crystallin family protein [Anaerolineaceae bacterium]|nr:Hsp20/alpha crystallin family protein [Anaerolineaceae bacterium]
MFRYNRNSVWNEMDRMRREMDRMFARGGFGPMSTPVAFPAVNVWVDGDHVQLTAELPGVSIDDVELSVVDDTLTLSGSRAAEEVPENATYHRRERGCGKFSRVIKLPYRIDLKKVDAKLENGVLNIHLDRAEEDKPRKIRVKAG